MTDLWNNPMVEEAKKNLSSEQIEQMKNKGEELFGSVDFEKVGDVQNNDECSREVLEQFKVMLRSGMHPSYFSTSEKDFLKNFVGEKWYEEYGYMKNDLNRINM